MKRILLITWTLLAAIPVFGQNNYAKADDFGRIVLTVHLDAEKSHVPKNAARILKNKMSQIVTQNGMGGSIVQRFIITANVNVLTQDITPTTPPMHAYTLDITFYIGDGVQGTLFSSTSVRAKGVGETEDKAFIAALKAVKVKDEAFAEMIATGKQRILEYYNSQCDMILAKARSMAEREEYDKAVFELVSVPEVCKECYEKAMEETVVIYQKQIDLECTRLLNEAKSEWNNGLDSAAAERASESLSKINPKAACYTEALALIQEIGQRIKEIDQREWEYAMQEQANKHEVEMAAIDAASQAQAYQHEAEMAAIEACKEIAVAEAENQPETVNYNYVWW